MKKKLLNVHPGELLREEFLKERRGITAETDLHLCAYLGLEPGYWLRVQLAYDLREAVNTIGAKVKATIKPLQAA